MWWWSLETCSNLFTWRPTLSNTHQYWHLVVSTEAGGTHPTGMYYYVTSMSCDLPRTRPMLNLFCMKYRNYNFLNGSLDDNMSILLIMPTTIRSWGNGNKCSKYADSLSFFQTLVLNAKRNKEEISFVLNESVFLRPRCYLHNFFHDVCQFWESTFH